MGEVARGVSGPERPRDQDERPRTSGNGVRELRRWGFSRVTDGGRIVIPRVRGAHGTFRHAATAAGPPPPCDVGLLARPPPPSIAPGTPPLRPRRGDRVPRRGPARRAHRGP